MYDFYTHTAACKECFDKFEHRLCQSAGCTINIDAIRKSVTKVDGTIPTFSVYEMRAVLAELDREKAAHASTSQMLTDELWSDRL